MVDWALFYAEEWGWSVFPVHTILEGQCSCGTPDCKNAGKHPRTAHGFTDASTAGTKIRGWWQKWPKSNIGTPLGNGLFVLDVDPRNGGDESLATLQEMYLFTA